MCVCVLRVFPKLNFKKPGLELMDVKIIYIYFFYKNKIKGTFPPIIPKCMRESGVQSLSHVIFHVVS